jgi:TonB family protein
MRTLTLLMIVVATLSTRGQDIPVANTASAKDHVGQVATVCGHVTGYSCSLPEESVVSLATNDRSQFTLRIPKSDLEKFGRGLDDRYRDRIVCATGLVEKGGNNLRIAVTDPSAILIRPDRPGLPAFHPDVPRACDPGVVIPRVRREEKARHTGTLGTVVVQVLVTKDGSVDDVRVIQSLDGPADRSFMQAARNWKFDPPMVHGKPSPLVTALSMTFTSR